MEKLFHTIDQQALISRSNKGQSTKVKHCLELGGCSAEALRADEMLIVNRFSERAEQSSKLDITFGD